MSSPTAIIQELSIGESRVTLLGAAHVSRASAEQVRDLLQQGDFDAVAVELCPSRYGALINPDSLAKMDLFRVLREGRIPMVVANLALGAYQQRLADQFGIEPGAEQRAAIAFARRESLPVLLLDREIGTTFQRISRSLSWWRRFGLFAGLVASVFSHQEVDEAEIERLKEGDVLESTFAQFADQHRDLYIPLIEERDRYMAARLRQELAGKPPQRVLAVVGAGHLKGIARFARDAREEPETVFRLLDQVPAGSRWPKLIPWAIVLAILSGFVVGFARSPNLGWQLVWDWILINGGLSAFGAIAAMAHPVTVLTAFAAAPITSLNPTVGAGMVTAAVEIMLRRPNVGDFEGLRRDTVHVSGWWRNRVSRVLLVFVFSTLGSAVGTYLAGFRIIGRLAA